MRVMPSRRKRGLLQRGLAYVLPHDVEYGRAYEAVLDGAGKQERTGVLDEGAHNVGTPALVQVVRALQASCHSGVRLVMVVQVLLGLMALAAEIQVAGLRAFFVPGKEEERAVSERLHAKVLFKRVSFMGFAGCNGVGCKSQEFMTVFFSGLCRACVH